MEGGLYVSQLFQLAQKLGLPPPDFEELESSGQDHLKQFRQRVRFNGQVFPEGVGNTKKVAKQNAAKNALERLNVEAGETSSQNVTHPNGQTEREDKPCEKTNELSVSEEDTKFTKKTDYKSLINECCQPKKLHVQYIKIGKQGPDHDPEFSSRLVIGNRQYPKGKGKTVKEAEQMAAQLALSALQEELNWDSKVSVGSAVSQEEASEQTSLSTTPSNLPESELSSQSFQSSGSDWVQFKDSSEPSNTQNSSSAQDKGLESNNTHGLTASSEQSMFEINFDCIEILGKGSFGSVYKARHKLLDKYRAIKEIRFKDLGKSRKEVKVLSELDHPNIVRYFSCWLQDIGYSSMEKTKAKFLFIEMELCDGGTLRRWIHNKNKELPENSRQKESLELALQMLRGVEYIHSEKLIHRDLKPENVLFGQDGYIRIGDFGLATQDNDEERTEDRGTRNYMAPEQVGVSYDRKVDVFALGLIFFELLWRTATGHERAVTFANVRHQTLPKEFSETYPIESHIIKKMLNENPEARPEASALKIEFEKWIQEVNKDQANQTV